jgi:hypothetical protein
MTPDESTALATWIAMALAAAFGMTGFVVGLIGLHHARQAKEAAAAANLIAKDANVISKAANTLSEESNDIAREAHEFSREIKDRENELHDVTWEWSFGSGVYEGMVEVLNVGKMIAKDATVQFRLDDATEATPELEIEGRTITRLAMPGLHEAISRERELREASRVQRDAQGFMVGEVRPFRKPSHVSRLRVTWRTQLGTSKTFDSELQTCNLPE